MARTYAAELASLIQIVEHATLRAEEDRTERHTYEKEARAHREEMNARLLHLEQAIQRGNERLEAIEPVVSMVSSVRAKITGGLLVLGVVGGIAWGGVVFFKEKIIAFLGA